MHQGRHTRTLGHAFPTPARRRLTMRQPTSVTCCRLSVATHYTSQTPRPHRRPTATPAHTFMSPVEVLG